MNVPQQAGSDTEPTIDPRVLMAADRTLLAWIRTGVAMMGFGFVVARFGLFLREIRAAAGHANASQARGSPFVGTALILMGAVVTAVAAVQHARFIRAYRLGQTLTPRSVSLATYLAAVLTVAGIGLAAYLIFL